MEKPMKNGINLAFVTMVTLSACGSEELPVEISTWDRANPYHGLDSAEVEVKSRVDEITVEDIVVNRGNCTFENLEWSLNGTRAILPTTLAFGESVAVRFFPPCSASQVDVTTDQGSWTLNY